MKTKLTIAALAALGATAAVAGPHMLERADQDRDGYVTLEEFRAAHLNRLDEHFARIDADSDGLLSEDEFEAAGDAHRAKRQQRLKEHHGKMRHNPERLVERLDSDGSGSLSLAEFEDRRFAPDAEGFSAADVDASGELDATELGNMMKAHRAARGDAPRFD